MTDVLMEIADSSAIPEPLPVSFVPKVPSLCVGPIFRQLLANPDAAPLDSFTSVLQSQVDLLRNYPADEIRIEHGDLRKSSSWMRFLKNNELHQALEDHYADALYGYDSLPEDGFIDDDELHLMIRETVSLSPCHL